ncbi:lipopolysaccharide biosynthesis protein [Kineococcus sp. NPDC059986]|uniref:lipopolysaccharide biosynthesis protein n=1 Tax=Kineococcus sp. NPDC059986 TaxID=3155538 RepID=UPI00344F13DE
MSSAPGTSTSPRVDLARSAARGGGGTLLSQALRLVLQLGSVVVLARLLDPAAFGLVAMVTSIIGVAELVRDFGLSTAATRVKELDQDQQTNLFWTNTALGLGCSVVAAALSPLVAAVYDRTELVPVVLALSAVFTLNGVSTQFRVDLTRQLRFGRLIVVDVAGQVAGIAVAITAAVLGAGLWALVAQQLTTAVVGCAGAAALSGFRPGLPHRRSSVRPFLHFGGRLLATSSLWYATKNVDNVVLGVVAGPAPLGVYARAYQLLMTPLNQLNAPLTRVAVPVLSAVQDDGPRYERYLRTAQLTGCYVTAPVLAVAAALASPVVEVLLGREWHAVAPVFAALAVGGVFRAVSQLAFWIYVSQGRPGAQFRMLLVTAPVMVALMVAGSPWGAVGVAVGHSAAHFLYWAVSLWHVGRVTGVPVGPLFTTASRAVLVVSLPMAVVASTATLLPIAAVLQIVAGVALAVLYAVVAALVLPWLRRDAVAVGELVRRATGRARPA